MLEDFKKFVMRGSVLDLAVGIIIGGAFGSIVTSLVNDIIMPPIGLVLGRIDFSNLMLVLQNGYALLIVLVMNMLFKRGFSDLIIMRLESK